MTTWPQVLRSLLAGTDLTPEAAAWAMDTLLRGEASDAQIAGFVTALRAKGEAPAEVDVFVERMLAQARLVEHDGVALDIVGTGGDHSHSVNISTMASLVAAAAGAHVVKHGNRAASSSTGTADVLEELGVQIGLEPAEVGRCVDEVGIGFCFAPMHHPAMRHVASARRDLGVPTVFNLLGPLANPGRAQAALVGCADAARAPLMAKVLQRRGVAALVVRGDDGLDEISTVTTTQVWDATGSDVVRAVIDPKALGVAPVAAELLVGGEPARNAELLRAALSGSRQGPDADRAAAIRDVVALNAAAALVAYDAARGVPRTGDLMDQMSAHLTVVRELLENGAALEVLSRWSALTKDLVAARG